MMRDNRSVSTHQSVSYFTTIQAGLASSVLTFAIRWVPDCVVNRKIVDSQVVNTKKSFINIGIAWDFAYRIPANTVSFPAQYHLKEYCLNHLDEHQRTRTNKIAIQALTGWAAALMEAGAFYPLDSMRTLAQTKPDVFQGKSFQYFTTHLPQLYRGLGLVLIRNSVTNIAGWGAKAFTETSLEKTVMPYQLQMMFAAFVFSFTRIVMGYPFTTINTLMQVDTQSRVAISMTEKCRYALAMINNRYKEQGLRSFYQGFYLKGGAQILTTFLQMWLFSWWIHPERKPLNLRSFFSAPQQSQFFWQGIKEDSHGNRIDCANSGFNKP